MLARFEHCKVERHVDNMFGRSNRTSVNLGELASSPMSSSSATAGISSAGSLLQSEREAVIGDVFVGIHLAK